MHTLIVGRTKTGKTWLSKIIAQKLQAEGYKVLVLDGMHDPGWREVSDFYTTDLHEFLEVAYKSRSCFLFIDEAGNFCGLHDTDSYWLSTQARHWGHSTFFITQRATQIAPTVRYQCDRLCLFRCAKTDSKVLADEFNEPILVTANTLKKLEFFRAGNFEECKKQNLLDILKGGVI